MRKVLAILVVAVALSGSLELKLDFEKIVIVSNSIDYSYGLVTFLKKSFDVTTISGREFSYYQNQDQYTYFVIVGGPDSPQGIGEIVRSILPQDEQDAVRAPGAYNMFIHTKDRKTYIVLAGTDREHTQMAAASYKDEITLYIPKNPMEWLETMDIREVTDMVITDLDGDHIDDYVFACRRVVSDPWDRGAIFVFEDYIMKWYYHLSTPIAALTVYDLESDRDPEIIVICDLLANEGDLYVFDTEGTLKWRQPLPGTPKSLYCYKNCVAVNVYRQGERVMIFDSAGEKVKDLPVNGDVSTFKIEDVNNDGEEELIVAGIVNNKWEHFLVVYDMDEKDHIKRVLWNYETYEHINDFMFYDIDQDGIKETILGAYRILYVTRGGDLLGRIELPPPILHVAVIEEQILVVSENTMFLINFSDVLRLRGDTTYVDDFTQIADSALRLAVEPQFFFLKDIDLDSTVEIVSGNGHLLEVHEIAEFAPPEIVITQPVAFIKEAEVPFVVYENTDMGFRMSYPPDWRIEEDVTVPSVSFLSRRASAAVDVVTKDVADGTTIEDTDIVISDLREEGYTIVEEGPVLLAGIPAHMAISTRQHAQYTIKTLHIWTIKNNKLYLIAYGAEISQYSRYQEIGQRMIDSFEILGPAHFISICDTQIDAPDDDNENLNREWIKICNSGTADVDLSGWALMNNAGAFYEFPDGFILRAGSFVFVYTGSGEDTETALYWGRPVEGWNNEEDVVTLQDSDGLTIDEVVWPPV
jgi:hypothetical protein